MTEKPTSPGLQLCRFLGFSALCGYGLSAVFVAMLRLTFPAAWAAAAHAGKVSGTTLLFTWIIALGTLTTAGVFGTGVAITWFKNRVLRRRLRADSPAPEWEDAR